MTAYDPNAGYGAPPASYPMPPAAAPYGPGYGGYGPGGYPMPPKKSNTALFIVIGLLVVAVIAAVAIALAKPSGGGTTIDPPTTGDSQPTITGDNPQPTETVETALLDVKVGDCFLDWDALPANIVALQVLACTTPHEAEVYAINPSIAKEGPVMFDFCIGSFESYVDVNPFESKLTYDYVFLTNNDDSAYVICVLFDKENWRVTTSYQGSGR